MVALGRNSFEKMVVRIVCCISLFDSKLVKMDCQHFFNLVNVRRETIIRLESGRYNPSVELAILIAKTLNVTVEDIFSITVS